MAANFDQRPEDSLTRRPENKRQAKLRAADGRAALPWPARLAGTNINPDTLLATDYLNHFNEVAMLIDLIPDMPDCLDDLLGWAPKSYEDHFGESGFTHRALAVEAFRHAAPERRAALAETVQKLDGAILAAIRKLGTEIDHGPTLKTVAADASSELRQLLERAGGIINGALKIGAANPGGADSAPPPEQRSTQDHIDNLFK